MASKSNKSRRTPAKTPVAGGAREPQPRRAPESDSTPAEPPSPTAPVAIVGVGASAGGIEAFTSVLKEVPPDTGLAFVFVQHLAPTHTSMLAEILQRATRMRVLEVQDQSLIERDCVYVIPPARGMVLAGGTLALTPRGLAPHHPVDVFFDSLATSQGHRAIGVVLSGTANDGTAGLAAIKAAGGITIAEDSSAQYDGMPRSAVAAGAVDFVLPPAGIARELARIAHHPYLAQGPAEAARGDASVDQIDQILDPAAQRHGRRLLAVQIKHAAPAHPPPDGAAQDRRPPPSTRAFSRATRPRSRRSTRTSSSASRRSSAIRKRSQALKSQGFSAAC